MHIYIKEGTSFLLSERTELIRSLTEFCQGRKGVKQHKNQSDPVAQTRAISRELLLRTNLNLCSVLDSQIGYSTLLGQAVLT